MRADCHVVLVSDQPTPNLTPVLDPELKPQEIVLVISPDMRRQAQWLAEALKDTGILVTRWPIEDAWNVEHVRDRILDLLSERTNQAIALNVTGGTKPMAIAAYEVFRAEPFPIFYVHPETDHLIWMYHPDRPPSRDLADRVKLERFFLAHGVRVTDKGDPLGVPDRLRTLNHELIHGIDSYQRPLGTLNWAAQTAERTLISDAIKPESRRDRAFQALLGLFERADYLRADGQRLVFPDEDSRFYANGGWLEAHVWGLCLGLKKETGIQDIGRGVEVERQTRGGPVPNELDIALLANNRLRVIECKTRRFDPTPGAHGKGADALYKLDALTDLLGGLKAKGMLVSYRNLSANDLKRAENHRIKVCDGAKLKELPAHLRQWIMGR
jgi:hypothetical protein